MILKLGIKHHVEEEDLYKIYINHDWDDLDLF